MGGKTHLDHDFHEVFLGNNILALDDLLENGGEDGISVELQIDAVELREANEICADQNTKVFPFRLTLLAVARRHGYAAVSEEFEPDLVGVAAPVRDFRGYVIGALNISAPKFRLGRALAAAGREVRAAAERLGRALITEPTPDQVPAALNPLGRIS